MLFVLLVLLPFTTSNGAEVLALLDFTAVKVPNRGRGNSHP